MGISRFGSFLGTLDNDVSKRCLVFVTIKKSKFINIKALNIQLYAIPWLLGHAFWAWNPIVLESIVVGSGAYHRLKSLPLYDLEKIELLPINLLVVK